MPSISLLILWISGTFMLSIFMLTCFISALCLTWLHIQREKSHSQNSAFNNSFLTLFTQHFYLHLFCVLWCPFIGLILLKYEWFRLYQCFHHLSKPCNSACSCVFKKCPLHMLNEQYSFNHPYFNNSLSAKPVHAQTEMNMGLVKINLVHLFLLLGCIRRTCRVVGATHNQ